MGRRRVSAEQVSAAVLLLNGQMLEIAEKAAERELVETVAAGG